VTFINLAFRLQWKQLLIAGVIMDNLTLNLISTHASCRHYTDDPVPVSVIETVVSAGQRASTSSNSQAYRVIAVTSAFTRTRMAKICGGQEHVAKAPVFLVFCADLSRLDYVCKLRGYTQATASIESFLVAVMDTALCAQTVALAAESLGLGICYNGSIRNNLPEVIDLLKLPRLVFPITGMTVGWPEKPPRLKPRLPLRAVLSWEKYNSSGEEEALREYDRVMIASGIYGGHQIPRPGKETEMKDYGWTEHTARRVSQPSRMDLRTIIERQGFGLE